MIEGPAVKGSPKRLRLRLGDLLIQGIVDEGLGTVQSAIALLRTVFEDHYVDPDHQSCLFFHGCAITGSRRQTYDFTVVHRGDRVILSDFTFPKPGPRCISLPLRTYAAEVLRFAQRVRATGLETDGMPPWQQAYAESQWKALTDLTELTHRFLTGEDADYKAFCDEFYALHGRLKRPLELQILDVIHEGDVWEPKIVQARVAFGPIQTGEVLPMRLNHGDVIRVSAEAFTSGGVILRLEGVGSGGVRPGDRLHGLQLFYP